MTQDHKDGYGYLREYMQLETLIRSIDRTNDMRRRNIEADEKRAEPLIERQEEIAGVIGPELFRRGPVRCERGNDFYMVASNPNESLLEVTKLGDAVDLIHFTPPPRTFSDAEITEAAMNAAVEATFPHPDDDADDTGEFPPVAGDVNARIWPEWTDKLRAALPTHGRTPTVHFDHGDQVVHSGHVASVSPDGKTIGVVRGESGRTPTIANGVAVIDQEAS